MSVSASIIGRKVSSAAMVMSPDVGVSDALPDLLPQDKEKRRHIGINTAENILRALPFGKKYSAFIFNVSAIMHKIFFKNPIPSKGGINEKKNSQNGFTLSADTECGRGYQQQRYTYTEVQNRNEYSENFHLKREKKHFIAALELKNLRKITSPDLFIKYKTDRLPNSYSYRLSEEASRLPKPGS